MGTGKIIVEFVIAENGRITTVKLVGGVEPKVDACVLRTFKRHEEDRRLREELEAFVETDEDRAERKAWQLARDEVMWRD